MNGAGTYKSVLTEIQSYKLQPPPNAMTTLQRNPGLILLYPGHRIPLVSFRTVQANPGRLATLHKLHLPLRNGKTKLMLLVNGTFEKVELQQESFLTLPKTDAIVSFLF